MNLLTHHHMLIMPNIHDSVSPPHFYPLAMNDGSCHGLDYVYYSFPFDHKFLCPSPTLRQGRLIRFWGPVTCVVRHVKNNN